jgi:HD-GYP domain-containing protein (c-di-GMP phosphodiesterase class II)
MLRILLIHDEKTMHDKLNFILESISGVLVKTTSDIQEATDLIGEKNEKHRFNMIIVNTLLTRKDVEPLQKVSRSIDCILVVDDLKDHEPTIGWKVLDKIHRTEFATKLKDVIEKIVQDRYGYIEKLNFCRIKTSILLETSPLHADIYAKLSDLKYIKIFLAGDTFDADDFTKYTEQRKIQYMYLREDNCKTFIEKYILQIDDFAKRQQNASYEQLSNMNKVAFESVQELINVVGFNKDVQRLAKSHISMMVHRMDKKPNLQKLLARVLQNRGQYLTDHAYILSYVSCGIATHLQWGSEATFYKLSLASFFHDIAIVNDSISACSSIDEVKKLGLADKEVESFKNHPAIAAELVRRMSEIPADVDLIIQQHHEMPDGKGFPKSLTANYISPLSSVFIIAHDMTREIMRTKEGGVFDLGRYLLTSQDKFQHSNFRRILAAAKKLEIPS